MKLGKLLGMKGGVLPKLKIMPRMKDLTGIKPGSLGIETIKLKRKKTSVFKTLKDV